MAKKSRKRGKRNKVSKAQKRARRAFAAASRARSHKPKKSRRARRARRAHKARKVSTVKAISVAVTTKRGRKRRKTRRFRLVRRNPGAAGAAHLGFLDGITGVVGNVKATAKTGIKGYAFLALGAGGAVFAGSLVQRVTQPIAEKFAPMLITNPMLARVFAAANFYAPAWLVQKYLIKDKNLKRGILAGAAVTAILELVKPGLVRENLAKLPVIGGVFGQTLAGLESDLSGYVDNTMSGLLGHDRVTEWDVSGKGPTVGMGAYEGGMNGYEGRGLNGYESLAGLGCAAAPDTTSELVTSGLADDGSDY